MRISGSDLIGFSTRLVLAAATIVCSLAIPATAQSTRVERDSDARSAGGTMRLGDVRRVAMVNGYAQGYEHGLADRRARGAYAFRHDEDYVTATSGYNHTWGFERAYQNAFRVGYEQGYGDGYYGRGQDRGLERSELNKELSLDPLYGYPSYRTERSGGYFGTAPSYRTDPDWEDDDPEREEISARAARIGYGDGLERGREDRATGVRRPNPQGHGAFAHGLNGWSAEWGASAVYQEAYRTAFLEGYWSGYGRK